MIKFVDVPYKWINALAQILATAGNSLAESGKYPAAARFYHDLAGGLGDELRSRDLFGVRTAGAVEIELPSLGELRGFERVLICDHLTEISNSINNPELAELVDNMVYTWFRDVETP